MEPQRPEYRFPPLQPNKHAIKQANKQTNEQAVKKAKQTQKQQCIHPSLLPPGAKRVVTMGTAKDTNGF